MCLAANVVEDDPVIEKAELYIREPVDLVSGPGNFFKRMNEVVGYVTN
jgi:hypothetical protein